MAISRRKVLIGTGIGIGAAYAVGTAGVLTQWFGLLPKEYETSPIYAESDLAIRGTDPVAYFTDGRPTAGLAHFSLYWQDVEWRFASAENRQAFKDDPAAYAPQYGGFCAWAVAAKGKLYSTQPTNWSLVDGKLYLNFNDDIQARWEADIPGFIAEGDRRWPEILRDA